jgi:deoxyribonuclease-4
MAHIHARGNGKLRTSEDYGELFDLVRETIGGKTFFCHFSGVEHQMGNALHYTQIKKSDLNFEPFAEFLVDDADWLDITIISDSPLLEHDAMYMLQQYERGKNRLLEKQARDERRVKLALEAGMDPEELAARESAEKEKRLASATAAEEQDSTPAEKKPAKAQTNGKKKEVADKKSAKSKKSKDDVISFDDAADDDDDLF